MPGSEQHAAWSSPDPTSAMPAISFDGAVIGLDVSVTRDIVAARAA